MPDDLSHGDDNESDTDSAGLDSFGVDTTTEPPQIQKRSAVHTYMNSGRKKVGYVGGVRYRHGKGFVTTRKSDTHRLRYLEQEEGGSYAISDDVLRRVEGKGATRIFVHEIDTGTVYEWPADVFIDGEEVPDNYLEWTDDTQRYASRGSAQHTWPDHAPHPFFIPMGESVNTGGDA